MARPSKPHLSKGYWRVRMNGETIWLGKHTGPTPRDPKKARMPRDVAAEWYRLKAEATRPTTPSDRPELIAGAVTRWLDLNPKPIYENWLKPLVEYAGGERLDSIDADFLNRYHVHLTATKAKRRRFDKATKTWAMIETDQQLKPETVRHYIRTATAVLKWAHKRKFLPEVPELQRLAKSAPKARDIAWSRVVEILDGMNGRASRAANILRFIAYTGCRPSEACHLRWDHVHLHVGVCVLHDHKSVDDTGEARTIYVGDGDAADLLRELADDGPTDGLVFRTQSGEQYTPSGLRSILKRHGGITPYQLRHSYAQAQADAGESLDDIGALLGHADRRSTKRYAKVRDARAKAAANRFRVHATRAG